MIFANSVSVSETGVIDPGVSGQFLEYVIRKLKWPKGEFKMLKVRSFKRFLEDEFFRDLRTIDWSCFLNFNDLDSICEIFNSNVKTVAEKHAPFVTYNLHEFIIIEMID